METGMFDQVLDVGGHGIHAISTAGVETCFWLPSLSLCLDIGRCPPGAERASTLLLTHAHIDHAAGLPYYVSLRSMIGAAAPRVFCPAKDRDALWAILKGWSGLQADSDRCELIGVAPGDRIELGKSTFAQTFTSPHRISTTGYTLVQRHKRLKAELVGRPQSEIAERARAGESVNEVKEVPQICFPGDTTVDVLMREPSVLTARVLLLECTFVGKDISADQAKRRGHMHLEHIAEHAEAFENEVLVLTHFSRRYSRQAICEEVKRKLPASLHERVQLVLPSE